MFTDMKGSQQILNKLAQDTKDKIAKINETNQKRASEILLKATEDAKAARQAHAEELKLRALELERRAQGAAELESKKQILAMKQSIIENAYAKAQEKLLAMNKEEYCKVISKFAIQAAQNNGEGELIFNAKDREQIGVVVLADAREKSGANLVLSDRTADICGGFILRLQKSEINCAIETLVQQQALINSRETASILFGV